MYTEVENCYVSAIKSLENSLEKRAHLKTLVFLSEFLYQIGRKEEAIQKAHLVLDLYYNNINVEEIIDRPSLDNEIPDAWVIQAMIIKARYFRDRYSETGKIQFLDEASFYYDHLLTYLDRLKKEYYSSSSKYRMGEFSQKIYAEIITFYVDQYAEKNNSDYLNNAFALAQRANAFVLRNAISDRKALELAGVQTDSLYHYLQLSLKATSDAAKDSTEGVEIYRQFDAYRKALLENYPSYGKYQEDHELTLPEVQQLLDEDELLLKYYYFENTLSVFGITKTSSFAENVEITKQLDSLIDTNLQISSNQENEEETLLKYLSNSKTIYDKVIGDFIQKFKLGTTNHLIIVPDGPLKKISFNALAINDSNDWNNPNTYLLSKYTLNYLYYCSQLKSKISNQQIRNKFIGYGIEYEEEFLQQIKEAYLSEISDTFTRTLGNLGTLKYADDEVITSSEIFNGQSVLNEAVTPSRVITDISDYSMIHFAAHAFVDEEDYLESYIVLNRDKDERYRLKYEDILDIDLNSDLVVLSACQTGSGKNVKGEGLMSLSRAFVQSGSEAALGTYWNTPDYSTKEIMTLFYANLRAGLSKSEALRQAQLSYLTDDNVSSPSIRAPFFWASWALYGNDEPLQTNGSIINSISWELYALVFFGIIVLLVLFYRKYQSLHF